MKTVSKSEEYVIASHRIAGMTMAILVMLALLVLLLGVRPAHAQDAGNPPQVSTPDSGKPTDPAPADDVWSHLKFGATLEGYYEYNANRPDDRIIALHAYDTRSNTFGIQQAAFIVEQPPDVDANRRFGLRLDFQFGQAVTALQGNAANEPRPDVYRNVWQAYGTYVFPVGKGLQLDFGKFASSLGIETNYAKDDVSFSRAYLFNFLPYYHSGLRTTLPLSDKVTVQYLLTNGIQQTEEFNDFKSSQFSAIVKPVPALTWTINYFLGQEQPDHGLPGGPDGWFHVFDTYATLAATKALTLSLDVTRVSNEVHAVDEPLVLKGVGAYARYQITPAAAAAVRYERLADDGLFGGVEQVLQEATFTFEQKFADGFLVRAEYRPDSSNRLFFPVHDGGVSRHQRTALVGLVWWIGNKTGAW